MSEHEKRSSGGAPPADSGAVLMESVTSRHKQPIRPIDMQEESHKELHHKQSKAPAVPSATQELKESVIHESKDKIETISSEKHKQDVVVKLSTVSKRRDSSPESLKLAPLAVDLKNSSKGAVQPIPAHVPVAGEDLKKKDDEEKDSITEELRAPEASVASEWTNKSGDFKKKGVSWNNVDYLAKVKLEDMSEKPCHLERKSSLGPCFRAAAPFGRPSGIAICLAKRSVREVNEKNYLPKTSIINISLSKRSLVNKTIYWDVKACVSNRNVEAPEKQRGTFFGTLKEKFSNVGNKIKNCI